MFTIFSQLNVFGIVFDSQGQVAPKRIDRSVLNTCNFDEDQIKNEGAIVYTTFSPL